MPVYQSDYVKPVQSDNPDYHSKFWEEFKPYPKEITGIRCKAKLIFCSDDVVTHQHSGDLAIEGLESLKPISGS